MIPVHKTLADYDEAIGIYVNLIEEAIKANMPLHDYQRTLDTLKAMRTVWVHGYEAGRSV